MSRFREEKPDRAERVAAAFRAANEAYELRPYPGDVTLFRPPLDRAHVFGEGRVVDRDRQFVFEDNLLTSRVGKLEILEVSGDHDSFVLEPHVDVLVEKLRTRLRQLEEENAPRLEASIL
jgi:hypothetical protein